MRKEISFRVTLSKSLAVNDRLAPCTLNRT